MRPFWLAVTEPRTESLPSSPPHTQQCRWQSPGPETAHKVPELPVGTWKSIWAGKLGLGTLLWTTIHVQVGSGLPRPTHRASSHSKRSTEKMLFKLYSGKAFQPLVGWGWGAGEQASQSPDLIRIKSVFKAWSFPAAWKQEEPNPGEQ